MSRGSGNSTVEKGSFLHSKNQNKPNTFLSKKSLGKIKLPLSKTSGFKRKNVSKSGASLIGAKLSKNSFGIPVSYLGGKKIPWWVWAIAGVILILIIVAVILFAR